MTVHAVELRRNTASRVCDADEYANSCFVYESGGDLFHAHRNSDGWSESRFSLRTLDHHLTMYHKHTFYATKSGLPDFVKERLFGPEPGEQTDD